MIKKLTVGLFGTCNGSNWRDAILEVCPETFDYFNPVVENWTPECQKIEIEHRSNDDILIYVLTPKTKGFYSWVEVIDSVYTQKPHQIIIFCAVEEDDGATWSEHDKKSITLVKNLLDSLDVKVFASIEDVIEELYSIEDSIRGPIDCDEFGSL